ncbi:SDR family oxidoreductase [Bradyrhizobium betae]|uniref:NmrA-like domain-containing protein n=1 Tax=Bradyrhizobium betae TaxID=244734 RepID=A0A4Q1VS36_9BRAD|nr:NmrA family NAD(P)-binding protein [Bradyrhizobium betae]RXT54250.1 hypothetical protein B5V03_02075 [Bradyrhizobium betae]
MRILVIGGTGNVGSSLVVDLLGRKVDVRVATRSEARAAALPANVEAFVCDIVGNPQRAAEAFRDIDAVFMLNAPSAQETVEGMLAVQMAREAGVRRFVYQSSHCLDQLDHIPHLGAKVAIQRAVVRSHMEYTFICPNHFFQNDRNCQKLLLERGLYLQPIGSVGCCRIDVRDIAEAAGRTLTEDGHHGKSYNLVGPEKLTGEDCAAIWSTALQKKVRYVGSIDTWQDGVKTFLPSWLVYDLAMMYRSLAAHGMLARPDDLDAVTALLSRAPRPFKAYVEETAAAWRKPVSLDSNSALPT